MQNHIQILILLIVLTLSGNAKQKPGSRHEPDFLKNASSSAKRAFFEISKNPGISIQQKEDKLKAWAVQNKLEDSYSQFLTNTTKRQEEISRNVSKVISRLSEAKEKTDAILADKSMTKIQQQEAIKDLKKQYPQEIPTIFFIGKQFGHGKHPKHDESNSEEVHHSKHTRHHA